MTIQTRPQFFYIPAVTQENQYLNFDEGTGELVATLDIGARNPQALLIETTRAMNEVAEQIYAVTLDRELNRVTISAPDPFDLLVASGSAVTQGVFALLGFTGADRVGLNTYTADSDFATVYRPQFYLQSYTPFEHYKSAVQASINESSAGVLEIITFGRRAFMEFNFDYVTDNSQDSASPIEHDPQGVANLRDFLEFLIDRAPLEFMPDRDDAITYDVIQLEKTATDTTGTGFRLREKFSDGLAGFYESGTLTFRKVG